MKHTFAKKALLMGVVALAFNNVAVYAMAPAAPFPTTPAALDQQVSQQAPMYAGWAKEALQKELKNLMRKLDNYWDNFMRCAKLRRAAGVTAEGTHAGAPACKKGEAFMVATVLLSILIILRALAAKVAPGKLGWTGPERAAGTFVSRPAGWVSEKATQAGRQIRSLPSRAAGYFVPGTGAQ